MLSKENNGFYLEFTGCFIFDSSEYENLAMRLLQCLYLSNPYMTRLALKRENFEFNKLSSLEVASMCFI
jgi:hypothetical protein